MKNLRKYLAIAIVMTMILSIMAPVVSAASLYMYEEEANELNQLDLYLGTNTEGEFEADLGSKLNRQTATVMLLRMFGEESAALAMDLTDAKSKLQVAFRDANQIADWAAKQVAYGVEKGYIKGYEDKTFRPEKNVTGREYTTLSLKMLGYTFEFNKAGELFGDVAELDADETADFGIDGEIKKDILVGISHRALLAKFFEKETTLAEKLIELKVFTFAELEDAAPSVAMEIEDVYVSPTPTTPETSPTPSLLYSIKSVVATNGTVEVMLDKDFEATPVPADFKVTQSLVVGTENAVETDVTGTVVLVDKTAKLTLTQVAAQPQDQTLTYKVSYKGSVVAESNKVTVVGSSVVTSVVSVDSKDVEKEIGDSVKVNSKIRVKFAKDVDVSTVSSANIYLTQGSIKQLSTVTYDVAMKAATIEPNTDLESGKEFTITVKNIKDSNGNALSTFTGSFKTSNNAVVSDMFFKTGANDNTWNVTLYDEDLDGGNVDTAKENFAITFATKMDVGTLTTSTVKLYDVDEEEFISLTVDTTNVNSTVANEKFLRVTPIDSMTAKNEYKLILKAGISDLSGNTLGEDEVAQFFYNGDSPAYGTVSPTNGADDVYNKLVAGQGEDAFRWEVKITKDLNPATVNSSNVYIEEAVSEMVVPSKVVYEAGSRYLIVTPLDDLKEDIEYKVTIKDVKGTNGLSLPDKEDSTAFTFTTGDFTEPTIVSVSPANAVEDVDVEGKIVITFSEKMNETTLAPGTYIVLRNASDDDVIVSNFSSWLKTVSEDGKTLTLEPTSGNKLKPNTTYKLEIEEEKLRDSSNNLDNTVQDDMTVIFSTANTATALFEDMRMGGIADANDEIKNGDTDVEFDGGDLYATFSETLMVNDTDYKLEDLVKVERYEAETGNWTTVATEAVAGANQFGVALSVSKKSIIIDSPVTRTNDADTDIDESSATYNDKLVKDTKYRVTIPGTVKDTNDNGVQAKTIEFTVGEKPEVMTANSFPAAFAVNVDTEVPYVVAVINDDMSKLSLSTLNSATVKFLKKSDDTAVPYTVAYVNNAKPVNEVLLTNGAILADATTVNFDGASAANVEVGDIVTFAGVTAAYVVTEVTTPSATFKVDRKLPAINDNVAITRHQGIVYELDEDKELASDTEYKIEISGLKDIAGNFVKPTTYVFRTEKVVDDLEVVSSTIADNATGVAVNASIKITFNSELGNINDESEFVNEDGLVGGLVLDNNTKRVAFQKADGTVVPGKLELESDDKVIKLTPYGFLVEDTVYDVIVDMTTKNNAIPAVGLDEDYTFSFRTEATASVDPMLVSAKYIDIDGDGDLEAGDVIRLTFNAYVSNAGLANYNDFTISGPASTLGTDVNGKVLFDADSDGKVIDITLVADSKVSPGISTIKVNTANGAAWTDGQGNLIDTDAVTITKN